jgi:hypothetical protein
MQAKMAPVVKQFTSHDLASRLIEMANLFIKRPSFPLEGMPDKVSLEFSSKETFTEAVKALGTGEKKYSSYYFDFLPYGTDLLQIRTQRNNVCVKIQDEKWECEPLLAAEVFPGDKAKVNED